MEFEAATPWGQLSMSEARKGKLILALEATLILDPQNEPIGSNFV